MNEKPLSLSAAETCEDSQWQEFQTTDGVCEQSVINVEHSDLDLADYAAKPEKLENFLILFVSMQSVLYSIW